MSSDPSPGRTAKRARTSILFRGILYVTATFGALMLLLVGVASTPWFHRALERTVVSRLEELTGGRVDISAVRFNPLVLQITLQGLTVHAPGPATLAPLFTAKKVVAHLALVPLGRNKLRLRALDWEDAVLDIRMTPQEATILQRPAAGLTPEKALDKFLELSVGRINLARTEVRWNDKVLPLDLDAQSVSILLRDRGGHDYAGSFSSSALRFRGKGWTPPPLGLSGQFEISRSGLSVKSLTWQSGGLRGRGSFNLSKTATSEGDFSFEIQGEVSEWARSLHLVGLRRGVLRLFGRGLFRHGEVTVKGQVGIRNTEIQSSSFNPSPFDLSSDYRVESWHIELSNLNLTAPYGEAMGHGDITWDGTAPQCVLSGQLRRVDLASVLRAISPAWTALGRLHASSRVKGSFESKWTGRFEKFSSTFDLQFQGSSRDHPGSLPLSGHARGRATQEAELALDLEEADFATPHSTLWLRGQLGAPQSRMALRLKTADFEEWRPLTEVVSSVAGPVHLVFNTPVTFSGTVTGPLQRPEIRGHLDAGAIQYYGWTWDSLTGTLNVTSNGLTVSSATLRKDASEVGLTAAIELENWACSAQSQAHISVEARRTPLAGLRAALELPVPLDGLATVDFKLEGPTSDLRGKGRIRVDQGSFALEPIDQLSAGIRVADYVWHFENIELSKGHGRLDGNVDFGPKPDAFSAMLQGKDFRLEEVKSLSFLGRPAGIEGRADFALNGEGTKEDLHVHSNLTIGGARMNGEALGDFRAQFDWQGEHIRFEGDGEGSASSLHFSGGIEPHENWRINVAGNFVHLPADHWIPALVKIKLSAAALASGNFDVAGPLADPTRIEANVEARELTILLASLTWNNEQPVSFHYAGGQLDVSHARMRGPSTDLEVEGSIRFLQSPSLSLRAQGQAEAALLSLLDPALQASGRSSLAVRVSGSPAHPLFNGTLQVENVTLKHADLPFRLSAVNGEIIFEGERATAHGLRAESGGGSVKLEGFVTLAGTPRFDLRATLDQVRVPSPVDFTSVLSGNLQLVGTPERAQLGGELSVRQILVNGNYNLVEETLSSQGPFEQHWQGLPSPWAPRVRLNVRVISDSALRFGTREWYLLTDIDLTLSGTLAAPVESGSLHFREGEVLFRGDRFKLTRGEVRVSYPNLTEPFLDLEAVTRVQRYDLTVNISGPADRLKLAYRSDPPLPTEEVLSLLALGFSRQQGERATATTSHLPTVEAGALLSQALSNQVTGRVQRIFGVSRIKVDPNVGGPGSPSGARVTVEQQVTPDLTLTYVTNTASSQYRVIQFEWALSENTSLVGVRDQNGIFGVEVRFRHRFR